MLRQIAKNIIVIILEWEARAILQKFKPKIVAITGSVGKTSTKDAMYAILSTIADTRKNQKSYNSEFGVPLTIIDAESGWGSPRRWLLIILRGLEIFFFEKNYPQWLVLEIGADRPGDIKNIASWLAPDIAVVTGIGPVPVHVEFFSSPETLVVEKSYLPRGVKPSGIAIMNHDDSYVREMSEVLKTPIISYGFEKGAHILATNDSIIYDERKKPKGMSVRIDYNGKSIPIEVLGALGRSPLYAMLAATAVGIHQGINLVSIAEALKMFAPPTGRMRIIPGIKESTIVDDSYNSSPIALKHALDTLARIETTGRKIAVLGDMMELGAYTKEEHEKAGVHAVGTTDRLFLVGQRVQYVKEAALEKGFRKENLFDFSDVAECGKYLQNYIEPNDVILVKGSQSVRLEKVVKEIMAHPERSNELLVRQDAGWENR